jgi:hypothetical protein
LSAGDQTAFIVFCGLVLGTGLILFDLSGCWKAGRAIFNIDIFSGVN